MQPTAHIEQGKCEISKDTFPRRGIPADIAAAEVGPWTRPRPPSSLAAPGPGASSAPATTVRAFPRTEAAEGAVTSLPEVGAGRVAEQGGRRQQGLLLLSEAAVLLFQPVSQAVAGRRRLAAVARAGRPVRLRAQAAAAAAAAAASGPGPLWGEGDEPRFLVRAVVVVVVIVYLAVLQFALLLGRRLLARQLHGVASRKR